MHDHGSDDDTDDEDSDEDDDEEDELLQGIINHLHLVIGHPVVYGCGGGWWGGDSGGRWG